MAPHQSATVSRRHRAIFVALITSAGRSLFVASTSVNKGIYISHRSKCLAFITSSPSSSSDSERYSTRQYGGLFSDAKYTCTMLQMSSSSPPSSRQSHYSSSSPGRGRKRAPQQTRNRGANAANRNRRGHAFRLEGGETRSRNKSNAKRAPRWEREGDRLYAEVTKQLDAYGKFDEADGDASEHLLSLARREVTSARDVCELLRPWTASDEQLREDAERNEAASNEAEEGEEAPPESSTPKKSPPFLWGSLPVGPVLASRLSASGRPSPTSVQRAAFPLLTAGHSKGNKRVPTKRGNAIIASPTGTGKTLAYLLPLLCTSPGGQNGEGTGGVLIVTPTIELACQIRREVDALWPRSKDSDRSSLFVVGADESVDGTDDAEDEASPGRASLRSIRRAPLIAGTPKMLRMLYREAERVANNDPHAEGVVTESERAVAGALLSNLRAVVLDEADRLLRTEAVAREQTERKRRKIDKRIREEAEAEAVDNYIPPPPPPKKRRLVVARQTQTEYLLRDLPIPSLDDVQIVCASATIGRTMRRQLMQILDAPSADAAAMLVTGDEDERARSKDAGRRRAALLPGRLRHAYRVVEGEGAGGGSDPLSREEGTPDPDMSTAEANEERRVVDTLRTLWVSMTSMEEARPIIVFPGRVGVERVRRELTARGLDDVRTLRNLDGLTPEADVDIEFEAVARRPDAADDSELHGWRSVPVYVIGERFARGLDLPDVERVYLLSPPSSAAGYAHMAGRTGRNGRAGAAVTLVRPRGGEAKRLAAIAEALGIKFSESMSGAAGGEVGRGVEVQDSEDSGLSDRSRKDVPEGRRATTYPWEDLSESELKQKKNAELYDYLVSVGEKINRRSKKAELVSAIQMLHSKSQ